MKNKTTLLLFSTLIFLTSCESEQDRKERFDRVEQRRTEREERRRQAEVDKAYRLEQEKIEREAQREKERQERAIYEKYINNSLRTGSTPYSKYYGSNSSCRDYGCSEIKVVTSNSDVLVTIKQGDKVVRHAYIRSGDSYTFSFPNGTYQPFFYYGKGWNPNKEMKNGEILGGFISNESFGKDDPQSLSNEVLSYSLILRTDGNFSTRPSNPEEAL